jgi:hypothetical protein
LQAVQMRRETSRVSFLMCPFCVRVLLPHATTVPALFGAVAKVADFPASSRVRGRVALTATRIAVGCSEQPGFAVYTDSDRVRAGESAASCSSVWSIGRGYVPGPLSTRVAAGRGQRTARMVGRD